ncbi:MAG: hypothetical protein K0R08_2192 [Solimicrobium sp.]|jgi:hypothetical protein|nr:hypothetical protein [Solimicrobium sp.]
MSTELIVPAQWDIHRQKIDDEAKVWMFNATDGNIFTFRGREYLVVDEKGKLCAVDQMQYATQYEALASITKFFTDLFHAICDFSFSSRETRLSERLMSGQHKHFRVDVDKNLLYRGHTLPDGKDPGDFEKIALYHNTYGVTSVFVNLRMLEYLKQQEAAGARVSITSTGGWTGPTEDLLPALTAELAKPEPTMGEKYTLSKYLEMQGLKLNNFDNKATLNEKSSLTIGLFQKYRVLRDTDDEKRWNIMMDDQWHQLIFFTFSINATYFGMG